MIYSNISNIPTKVKKEYNIKNISTSKAIQLLKKEDIIFLDTETYAHIYNKEKYINEYIEQHVLEGKKVTATTRKSAETYAETIRGKMALNPFQSRIRMLQISTQKNIFLLDSYEDDLTPVFHAIKNKNIVGQNLKFDLKVIETSYFDIQPKALFDTMIAHKLYKNETFIDKYESHLGDVVQEWCDIEIKKGFGSSDWSIKELTSEQIVYCIEDVEYLPYVFNKQKDFFTDTVNGVIYFDNLPLKFMLVMEMKFIEVVTKAELEGIPVNINFFEERIKQLQKEIPLLEKKFKDVNVNSYKQVLELFKKNGIDSSSTDEAELMRLQHKYPLAFDILQLRKKKKELTLSIDYCNKWNIDGKIYPNFNQLESKTGRMSCSKPNTQQIKRNFKNDFYKSEKNYVILKADYPSIEPRIISIIAKDNTLLSYFKEKKDPYKHTASYLLSKPVEKITDEERRKAKAVMLGFMYGMGVDKFLAYAYEQYGVQFSREEAEILKLKFFLLHSGIKNYHRNNSNKLNNNASTTCRTLLGRGMRCAKFTDANNFSVQGTGADILKIAGLAFYTQCKKEKIDATIVNFVHDELIVKALKKDKNKAISILKYSMENIANHLLQPIQTEVEIAVL